MVVNLTIERVHDRVLRAVQVFADEFELLGKDEFALLKLLQNIQAHLVIVDIVEGKLQASVAFSDLDRFLFDELVVLELSEDLGEELIDTVAVDSLLRLFRLFPPI